MSFWIVHKHCFIMAGVHDFWIISPILFLFAEIRKHVFISVKIELICACFVRGWKKLTSFTIWLLQLFFLANTFPVVIFFSNSIGNSIPTDGWNSKIDILSSNISKNPAAKRLLNQRERENSFGHKKFSDCSDLIRTQ